MIKIFNLIDYCETLDYTGRAKQVELTTHFKFENNNAELLAVYYDEVKHMYHIWTLFGRTFKSRRMGELLDLYKDEHCIISQEDFEMDSKILNERITLLNSLKESVKTDLPDIVGYVGSQMFIYYKANVLYIPSENVYNAKLATIEQVKEFDRLVWYNVKVQLPTVPKDMQSIIEEVDSVDFSKLSKVEVYSPVVEEAARKAMELKEFPVPIQALQSSDKVVLEFPAGTRPEDMIEHIKIKYGLYGEESSPDINMTHLVETARLEGFAEQGSVCALYREDIDVVQVDDTDLTFPIFPELDEMNIREVDIDSMIVKESIMIIKSTKMLDSSDIQRLHYFESVDIAVGKGKAYKMFIMPSRNYIYLKSDTWILRDGNVFGIRKMERR